MDSAPPCKIGDKSTSDIVVRLRTQEGRDDRFYCHSHILVEKSKYFAERLSENWPTCQILDSRNCVEVHCQESDFNHHVNFIRLLYDFKDCSSDDIGYGVKNTLGILQVAVDLGSPKIATACVNYLEAVPWEEADEEEILRIIPAMGPLGEPILARLQPVDPSSVRRIFLATVCFVTSSPPLPLNDLKTSAQEQLEYMLTEDDDAPLLTADDELKFDVKECVKGLFTRFNSLLEDLLCDADEPVLDKPPNMQAFLSFLSDLLWASQILNKLEIMREFVNSWVDVSYKVIQVSGKANLSSEIIKLKLKIIEVAVKVLEAIGYGTVILPTAKRLQAVKAWLPFVQVTKPLIDTGISDTEDSQELKVDGEMWQTLESSFISTLLALPSEDQAEILTDWLGSEHIRYPDFSEAFELWCYRSKVAKRRLQDIGQNHRCGN